MWYEQAGQSSVKEVLTAFLKLHNDVFEIDSDLVAAGLPNLTLVKYGVGRHFRRAEFTQNIAGTPLLDGKTLVLFDLNWNVIAISRQLMTAGKLTLAAGAAINKGSATQFATNALASSRGKPGQTVTVTESRLGIDMIRALRAWQIDIVDPNSDEEFTVTLDAVSGQTLNISDNTANYTDAQVKRWEYTGGDLKVPGQTISQNIYTHDDNTLVHDFFYLVNDDRNDGGTGTCTTTPTASSSTPNAYGTTTSTDYVRPTRRGDRNFSLWGPNAPKGSFGEGQVYYWAREYMLWQKQALVDLGVLTLGNFNNYTKALIIVNACKSGSGSFKSNPKVSTMDDLGENLGTIFLPERCRKGNSNCAVKDYTAKSDYWYTFEGNGGYNAPGVIHHELNHFVLIKYFGVNNSLNCGSGNEAKFFQEGGLGRTLAQMYWHHRYGVGYIPTPPDDANTNKLFHSKSTDISGRAHDPANAGSLNNISSFACSAGTGDPYSWGGVVTQPMWEIYHGQKVVGASLVPMARPAQDLGMIKAMYYAADMTSASASPTRLEFANRFMEFWELFSTAVPTTKTDWCEVWGHHGMDTSINVNYCS